MGAEVVLGDGGTVRASAGEHPDLFWALRGGGGDFGAVTRFEFLARPVGPTVLGGLLAYPWERGREVFGAARALMTGAPEALTTFVVLVTAPPQQPFPPELQGRPAVVVAVCWSGEPADGERVLAPLRGGCPPVLDLVGPMPYVALQSMLDATAPHGANFYDRMHFLPEVSDGFVDALLAGFERVPTPQAHVNTAWMGGAVDRAAPGATAFGHRGAGALTWIVGASGEQPVGPAADWVRDVWAALAPHATGGVYANALQAEGSARDAYGEEAWRRLVAVKRRYDPDGVFAGNGIAAQAGS